jgi:hypothetical protein
MNGEKRNEDWTPAEIGLIANCNVISIPSNKRTGCSYFLQNVGWSQKNRKISQLLILFMWNAGRLCILNRSAISPAMSMSCLC